MSARPWHKRYHGDALTGFMVLTLEERGAYQTLLDLMYDAGGPLPDNEGVLARYMGVSIRKWRSLRHALVEVHGKISVDRDGKLTNNRVISEVENAAKTSRKNSENATKTNRKTRELGKNFNENNDGAENSLPYAGALPDTRSQIPEDIEEDKSSSQQEGDLAFRGSTIRLNQSDLDAWRGTFHAIPDINAELVSLDSWFSGPGRAKRRVWFHTTAGALSRKHQEFMREASREVSFTSPC